MQTKLKNVPTFAKRSFYHSILKEDKKTMTITFQNHKLYRELKVGSTIGMRALLDPLICKKHILENKSLFCKTLGLDLDALWDELVKEE